MVAENEAWLFWQRIVTTLAATLTLLKSVVTIRWRRGRHLLRGPLYSISDSYQVSITQDYTAQVKHQREFLGDNSETTFVEWPNFLTFDYDLTIITCTMHALQSDGRFSPGTASTMNRCERKRGEVTLKQPLAIGKYNCWATRHRRHVRIVYQRVVAESHPLADREDGRDVAEFEFFVRSERGTDSLQIRLEATGMSIVGDPIVLDYGAGLVTRGIPVRLRVPVRSRQGAYTLKIGQVGANRLLGIRWRADEGRVVGPNGGTKRSASCLKKQGLRRVQTGEPTTRNRKREPERESSERLLSVSSIGDIASRVESQRFEMKETLAVDAKTGARRDELVVSVLKTIAGFLNSEGGLLLIGVNDIGQVTGLKQDYAECGRKKDKDGFEQKLRNLVWSRLQPPPAGKLGMRFEHIDNEDVCVVEVEPSREIVVLDGRDIYLRDGNVTRKLEGRQLTRWIRGRDFENREKGL